MAKPSNIKLDILGSQWELVYRSIKEDKALENCDGYCDWTIKTIVVEYEMSGNLHNIDLYAKKVARHEIVHAFLYESGLGECSQSTNSWSLNEEMIDWFARQGVKIHNAWEQAGAL